MNLAHLCTLLVVPGALGPAHAAPPAAPAPATLLSAGSAAYTALGIDSGPLEPAPAESLPAIIFSTVARVPGAAWIRLRFADAAATVLSGDPGNANASRIRITGLLDGARQTLNAEHLEHWGYTSAYFNGEAALIELIASPNTGVSRVVIDAAEHAPPSARIPRSLCGPSDDRVPSTDPRCARLSSDGCTAWLINDLNAGLLTAGHCRFALATVASFNTPLSTPNGEVQFPPPIDQYPVELTSAQGANAGPGADWQYFACLTNSESGLTPFQRQQARFTLAPAAPAVADARPIRITGYGAVAAPVSPMWNGAQKTHVGPYAGLTGSTIRYAVDTTGGNSGSAVLDEQTSQAIGVHTHEGCTDSGGANLGTAIHAAPLQAALAAPRGLCRSGLATPAGPLYIAGDLANNFGTAERATGLFAKVSDIPARMHGLAYDPAADRFFCTTESARLLSINPDGGAVVASVPLATSEFINGLAFDPASSTLFGIVGASGQLLRIDPTSGAVTPIGPPSGGNVAGLEFDPLSGLVFGIEDAPGGSRLVRFRTDNGARSVVGLLGVGANSDCNGLSWGGGGPNLFTIDALTDRLIQINPRTGAGTVVGSTRGLFGSGFGLALRGTPAIVCAADFNADNAITVGDIFDFVQAWFARSPAADINDSASVTTADLYAFIGEWFVGACR